MELRPAVWEFAEAMEKVLAANDYRGSWRDAANGYLGSCLFEHFRKLEAIIIADQIDVKRAKKECIHIANFSMMIFDNLNEEDM